jgi:hypothetical protein
MSESFENNLRGESRPGLKPIFAADFFREPKGSLLLDPSRLPSFIAQGKQGELEAPGLPPQSQKQVPRLRSG